MGTSHLDSNPVKLSPVADTDERNIFHIFDINFLLSSITRSYGAVDLYGQRSCIDIEFDSQASIWHIKGLKKQVLNFYLFHEIFGLAL